MISSISGMGACQSGLNMSAVRRPSAEEMFNKIDQNGDGTLDKAEFEAFASEMPDRGGQGMDVEQLFAEIDASGDGVIDQSELETHHAAMEEKMASEMPPPPPPSEDESDLTATLLDMLAAEEEQSESINILA